MLSSVLTSCETAVLLFKSVPLVLVLSPLPAQPENSKHTVMVNTAITRFFIITPPLPVYQYPTAVSLFIVMLSRHAVCPFCTISIGIKNRGVFNNRLAAVKFDNRAFNAYRKVTKLAFFDDHTSRRLLSVMIPGDPAAIQYGPEFPLFADTQVDAAGLSPEFSYRFLGKKQAEQQTPEASPDNEKVDDEKDKSE